MYNHNQASTKLHTFDEQYVFAWPNVHQAVTVMAWGPKLYTHFEFLSLLKTISFWLYNW